jgi:ribosomal subunit interface protein
MAADREKVSSGIDAQLRAASTSAGECGVEDQVGRVGVTPPIWGNMGKEPDDGPQTGPKAPQRGPGLPVVDGDRTTTTHGGPLVEIVVTGRHIDVPALLRTHAEEKLAKVAKLAPKAQRVDVEVSRERNPRMSEICERVELTCVSPGPVIRAEASAHEMLEAFDLAWAKLESRLRKAADRRHVHRGARTPVSVASATKELGDRAYSANGAATDAAQRAASVSDLAAIDDNPASDDADTNHAGPMLMREKLHKASPMTLDQALYEMELVGHAFFLFVDQESALPSVVYRRHGYDYGVIRIDTSPDPVARG